MARLNQVAPETAVGPIHDKFELVQKALGKVPNLMKVFANSPAVFDAYLQASGAMRHGKLRPSDRELISLATAEANGCDYCLSAHTAIGKMVGLTADQIRDARQATSVDRRSEALLKFAHQVLEARGRVSDADLQAFRDAGFDDEAAVEVVANVAVDVLTNFTNNLAQTDIDWPLAEKLEAVRA